MRSVAPIGGGPVSRDAKTRRPLTGPADRAPPRVLVCRYNYPTRPTTEGCLPMNDSVWDFLLSANSIPTLTELGLVLLALAMVMWPLEQLFPAQKQPTVRRPGTRTDLVYWFFTPICTKVLTNVVMIATVAAALWLIGQQFSAELLNGFGPLAQQPIWLQAIEMIILGDFLDYWSHRTFHTSRFWRFHAIHHSPRHMDWLAYGRMHPVNDAVTRLVQVIPILALGYSPLAVASVLPFMAAYVLFLHSNVRWGYGPLKYVLVSPAYHRWHHAADDDAVDVNFAGFFPIWDLLFGTFYLPGRLPQKYGVRKEVMPESFWGQMLFPFRRVRYRSANIEPRAETSAG